MPMVARLNLFSPQDTAWVSQEKVLAVISQTIEANNDQVSSFLLVRNNPSVLKPQHAKLFWKMSLMQLTWACLDYDWTFIFVNYPFKWFSCCDKALVPSLGTVAKSSDPYINLLRLEMISRKLYKPNNLAHLWSPLLPWLILLLCLCLHQIKFSQSSSRMLEISPRKSRPIRGVAAVLHVCCFVAHVTNVHVNRAPDSLFLTSSVCAPKWHL